MPADLQLTPRQRLRLRLRSIVSGRAAINPGLKAGLFPVAIRALGAGLPGARGASA